MKLLSLVQRAVGEPAWRRLPWHLAFLGLAITSVGALFIWSAQGSGMAVKHAVFAGIGMAAFIGLSLLDYRHLSFLAIPAYALGIFMLLGLFPFGQEINNATRWYDLGPVSVQPSEPVKFLVVLLLADYFATARRCDRLRDLALPLAVVGLPMMLIAAQPDLGTALVLVPAFFAVAFLAGTRMRTLALLVGAGVVVVVAGWFSPAMKDYQRERVIAFVQPERVAGTNAAAHHRQVIRAIRAGGLDGEGWGRGVLNRRGLLSERHTDFIFVVIAEEWGFWRTAALVLVYLVLIGVMLLLTGLARQRFGRLLAGGVTAMIASQALINMAIAVRLAPITGLTLPLVSYGGSSLVTTWAGLGLVASVHMHPMRDWFQEE
jgi:rod shape determining protein RodA